VTLGAHSVRELQAFYRSWGWLENEGGSDNYVSFTAGSVRIAVYPIDRLRDEAAPSSAIPPLDLWNGVALAMNFQDRPDVDLAVQDAVAAGAALIESPVVREWAVTPVPEGHRWELAWAPDFDPS